MTTSEDTDKPRRLTEPWDGKSPLDLGDLAPGESVDVPLTDEAAHRLKAEFKARINAQEEVAEHLNAMLEKFNADLREIDRQFRRKMWRLLGAFTVYVTLIVVNALWSKSDVFHASICSILAGFVVWQAVTNSRASYADWQLRWLSNVVALGGVALAAFAWVDALK